MRPFYPPFKIDPSIAIIQELEHLYKDSLDKNGELATLSYFFTLQEGYRNRLEHFSIQIVEEGKELIDAFTTPLNELSSSTNVQKNKERIEGLLYKIKSTIYYPQLIKYSLYNEELNFSFISEEINKLSELTEIRFAPYISRMESYLEFITQFYELNQYLEVLNSFVNKTFTPSFDKFNPVIYELDFSSVDKTIRIKTKRVGGNKTPQKLFDDLSRIIMELSSQKRFYNSEGKFKPTTIAKYALSLDWFADKWDYSERRLNDIIKELI